MQEWRYAFEILVFVAWGVSLWRSLKDGRPYITVFLGATAFGLLVEMLGANPRAGGAALPCVLRNETSDPVEYCYGQFFWMVRGVPVCIGLGWSVLLFAVIRATARLRYLRWGFRPFFAAALAICLDSIMDPVASNFVAVEGEKAVCKGPGLEMWFWIDHLRRGAVATAADGVGASTMGEFFSTLGSLPYCQAQEASDRFLGAGTGLHYHLFDVPLTNFIGWWCVVFFFTLLAEVWMQLSTRVPIKQGHAFLPMPSRRDRSASMPPLWREILVVLLIVACSAGLTWLAIKHVVNAAYLMDSHGLALFFVLLMFLPGPLAFIWYLPRLKRSQPIDPSVLLCALLFSGFFLVPLWRYDIVEYHPLLIVLAPSVVVSAWVLFTWPYRNRLRRLCFGSFGRGERHEVGDNYLAPD